ncbi:cytochrome b/b6 domain-containing protein [Paucibacter sp. XJ19-41]|uniref:cytochrome b/b6 domain-containing protein n=1 Tax=Paucibacter sp. XJ19-41 TaxID=2927824 RepID=UPI00234A05CF|nr:cytochrome b/b6 domain-containing protein [Paucibacter sp. XJ19-41]MDC6171245.1 cytochrome b/b6 domain-containing protein [Paucibacter sp. XJ19-41]
MSRTTGPQGPVQAGAEAPVWDRFVRLFHWSLVACVLFNLFVLDDGEPLHRWSGYLASALVLARIVWGFVGSRHARFADFFPTPARLAAHLRALRSGELPPQRGHNPLGALMMLALLALVLLLGLSGWMQGLDAFWGEEWLEELHEGLANTLLGLVGLHVAAALLMGRLERTRLIRAMVTGVKQRW